MLDGFDPDVAGTLKPCDMLLRRNVGVSVRCLNPGVSGVDMLLSSEKTSYHCLVIENDLNSYTGDVLCFVHIDKLRLL